MDIGKVYKVARQHKKLINSEDNYNDEDAQKIQKRQRVRTLYVTRALLNTSNDYSSQNIKSQDTQDKSPGWNEKTTHSQFKSTSQLQSNDLFMTNNFDDPEHFLTINLAKSDFKGRKGPKKDDQGNFLKRTICGSTDLYQQTSQQKFQSIKIVKLSDRQQLYQIEPRRTINKSVAPSLGYLRQNSQYGGHSENLQSVKSQSRIQQQQKNSYQTVNLNDKDLDNYINTIDQRIERLQSNITPTRGNSGPHLLIDKAPKSVSKQSQYGVVLREQSDQKKLQSYQNYLMKWHKQIEISNNIMVSKPLITEKEKEEIANRKPLITRTESYLQRKQEAEAMKFAKTKHLNALPTQAWYDSLRIQEGVPPANIARSKTQEKRTFYLKLNSNRDINDLYARMPSVDSRRSPSSNNLILVSKPSFQSEEKLKQQVTNAYGSQLAEIKNQLFIQTALSENKRVVSRRDPFAYLKKMISADALKKQLYGCENLEELNQIKIEGQSQLKREIEGCKRIDQQQRFFFINAQHKNEITQEFETDMSKEVIAEDYETKLLY